MAYTVSQVAERTGISIHTLRYYDNEGLLPNVKRSESGRRMFDDYDLLWLELIDCFKQTGMNNKTIKQYIVWMQEGDASLDDRLDMMHRHREKIRRQLRKLEHMLRMADFKVWYYQTAVDAGTEKVFEERQTGDDFSYQAGDNHIGGIHDVEEEETLVTTQLERMSRWTQKRAPLSP